MKKLSIIAISLLAFASSALAQEQKFIPGWQLGVKGGIGMTVGETNEVFKYLTSGAADIAFGYRFTPLFTLRADFTGWQGKGVAPQEQRLYAYGFNYIQGAVDVVFDFCNMFSKYKPHVANPYIFVGGGGMVMFNNGAEKAKLPAENYWWDGTTGNWVARVGLGIDFRITKLIGIELELVENMTGDKFNSKKGDVLDHQLQALLGLRFDFGENKNGKNVASASSASVAASDAAAAAAAATVATAAASENVVAAVAPAAPAPEPAPSVAAVQEASPGMAAAAAKFAENPDNCVYFLINKSTVRDNQMAKISKMAAALKADPSAKVMICGYADRETGNPKKNMILSSERALNVKDALVAAGVAADRIEVSCFGDTVQPFDSPEKNRVVVMVR